MRFTSFPGLSGNKVKFQEVSRGEAKFQEAVKTRYITSSYATYPDLTLVIEI